MAPLSIFLRYANILSKYPLKTNPAEIMEGADGNGGGFQP
jgi:hypothetical protein